MFTKGAIVKHHSGWTAKVYYQYPSTVSYPLGLILPSGSLYWFEPSEFVLHPKGG